MLSKQIELLVGLFIALSIGAFFLLAYEISDINKLQTEETYELVADFDNVGGLKPRAPVKVGGVVVGRIKEITLDEESMMPKVKLAISSRFNKFPSETSAAILTAGLLGEQFISLTPGADEELLEDGDQIYDTQSAIVLEELIGKFMFNQDSTDL
ncbi:MAG: outer membrane lipid asymmetry maintenance protein MlaD [Pseudomonadota bacterium]